MAASKLIRPRPSREKITSTSKAPVKKIPINADVTLLNRYLNQQGRDVVNSNAKAHSIRDWGQGFEFNFKSGYTEGPVGFGLDLQAFYGLKLDSGGDLNDKDHQGRYPGSMFPLDNGKSADQFGVLSPTFKMRFAKDELRVGTLYGNNPVLANTDGRLYQQTNTGVQLVSKDLSDFTFTGGDIFKTKIRNETGDQGMITAGGTKESDRFLFGGADYTGIQNTTVSLWYSNLEDYYQQFFVGAKRHDALSVGALDTDVRVFRSLGVGGNADGEKDYAASGLYGDGVNKGRINQTTASLLESYSLDGHTVGLGIQKNSGESDFPYLDSGLISGDTARDIKLAETKTRLEDLYLPYKQKRRTKGQIALEAGLGVGRWPVQRPDTQP